MSNGLIGFGLLEDTSGSHYSLLVFLKLAGDLVL